MTIKPFYIKTDGLQGGDISFSICLCVKYGASACEGELEFNDESAFRRLFSHEDYQFFGVDSKNNTMFYDDPCDFGRFAIEITIDQLPAHLGIDKTETPEEKEALDLIETSNAQFESLAVEVNREQVWKNGDDVEWDMGCTGVFVGYLPEDKNKCVIHQPHFNRIHCAKVGELSKPETPQEREEREREQEFKSIFESDDLASSMNVEIKRKAMRHMFDLMIDSGYRKDSHGKK